MEHSDNFFIVQLESNLIHLIETQGMAVKILNNDIYDVLFFI